MTDQIKLDKIIPSLLNGGPYVAKEPPAEPKQEGVTITNNLNKLVNLMKTGDESPNENARVQAMKLRIQSNDYKIDYDKLSERIINSGVLKVKGG